MKLLLLLQTIIFLLLALFFTGCSKDGSNPSHKNTNVQITSINLNFGPYNTMVIITGTGFSSTLVNNKVFFNGKLALVTVATATQLTASVPIGAGTGKVSVSVNNSDPVSGPLFTYQFTAAVSTFAGNGSAGNLNGKGAAANFNGPTGIAIDAEGNLYVCDLFNYVVRKIDTTATVTTFAGGGGSVRQIGFRTDIELSGPDAIVIDKAGNFYIADQATNNILKIISGGYSVVFAGNFNQGSADGIGTAASFAEPMGLAIDANGNIYVADYRFELIRKITPDGLVTTLAGNKTDGLVNGTGSLASFDGPYGIACDASGNIFVSEINGCDIRKIDASSTVSTFVANTINGAATTYATTPHYPYGIVIDSYGNMFVADDKHNQILQISPNGLVMIIAGNGNTGSTNGPGNLASFNAPNSLAIDSKENLYLTDYNNNSIRKITLQ